MLCVLQRDEFDVLIIGAGATGSGCALDAATRGLKVRPAPDPSSAAFTTGSPGFLQRSFTVVLS